MDASKRVILNTAVSYISLLVKMAVGLFIVRFILQALGEVDYGIYIAVAGVVGLLDILNANMTNTSMRFLAHSLGSNDMIVVKKTFNSTLFIHYLIGALTVVVMEVGGLLMLEYVLKIPAEKMMDAHIIFQFMIVTMFISVIAVPYDAVINAHEKIWVLSLFDIVGTMMSLGLAIFLLHTNGNRLVLYGFFLMMIQIILRILKCGYSKYRFEECKNTSFRQRDKSYIKSILSYTGWNLFGSIAASLSYHLRGIVLNVFFGVRLNAAEGVSRRINNYVNMVSVSMTKAINPQIMKSEGGGNRKRMLYVTELAAKYSSFLFGLVAVPFAIEVPYILKIWLVNVPNYAVVFCQLSIINLLISKFTFQIVHAIQAVGNIRDFQLTETILCLLPLPLAYFVFKEGASPEAIYYIGILMNIPIITFRFYFGKKVAELDVWHFIRYAILPTLIPLAIATTITICFVFFVPASILRTIMSFMINMLLFICLFWFIGLGDDEKTKWKKMIKPILEKIRLTI